MSELLDELYLTWLYSQFASVRLKNPQRTHWSLARQLYKTEFVWFVPNDDNRAEDGCALRDEYFDLHPSAPFDRAWRELPCSMLEMLIALSRRLSFEAGGKPAEWFWHLLHNLGLDHITDKTHINHEEVEEILDTVNQRTYAHDGQGGLFPLKYEHEDQRKVEIWYQLSSYLLERA